MKNIFLITLVLISNFLFGQIHEIGGFVGASNFIGDIGSEKYISPNKLSGGLLYKYNLNSRVAFRTNVGYFGIKGQDSKSSNEYRKERNINFTNNIIELGVGFETSFWSYDIATNFTPYILTQISIFRYFKPFEYKKDVLKVGHSLSYAIPVGVGVKGRLTSSIAYAAEIGVRFTMTDDIDYTTASIPILNFGGQTNDYFVFTGVSLVYTFGRPNCYTDRF